MGPTARQWLDDHRMIVDDGSAGGGEPWRVGGASDPAAARRQYYESCLALIGDRSRAMRDSGEAVRAALESVAVDELPTGYCAAQVRPVGDQFAVLVDSGLTATIGLGAVLLARHFSEGLLSVPGSGREGREAFARLFAAHLGQYYLYGRFRRAPELRGSPDEEAWTRALTREAVAFVLGHELGHVIAGHRKSEGSARWLDPGMLSADVLPAAEEVEADAVGLQLVLGDLWGRRATRGLVDLRLTALRLAMNALGAVEGCYLVPAPSRHLPAARRWAGARAFLASRFPERLLAEHDRDAGGLLAALSFPPVADPEPPAEDLDQALARHGWTTDWDDAERTRWRAAEVAAWQFRLGPMEQLFLIGAEATGLLDVPVGRNDEVLTAGAATVAGALALLPIHLAEAGDGRHGHAGTADLVRHLRRRASWPEPFRSDPGKPLPIHLVAAAIARELTGHRSFGESRS